MSPITSSSVSSIPPVAPTSATNTVVGAGELQKQVQEQTQKLRETVKPVAEQVYISKQAQQQLDTYVASANQANDTTSSSSTSSTANTEQAIELAQTVQKRQTTAALAEYAQQQAQASSPSKPEPRAEVDQKQSTSIKALA